MGVFSPSIPDTVPDNVTGDYCIIYNSHSDIYVLLDGVQTVITGDDYDLITRRQVTYNYDNGVWSTAIGNHLHKTMYCRSDTYTLVYSTYDIMTSDNKVYHYSGYSGSQNVFCGTLSSSTILTSLKDTVFPVVPLIAVPIISYIAFKKAWNFFFGGVRGA